jgi:carboxypeptidase C (cathepsin A)
MFSFNGGPGSASVWLHLGALGPKRVSMPETPTVPSPPFRLVENDASWLDRTDLVFVDPVGTGYSRAAKPDLNKKFHGVKGDIESIAEFIRMYLTRNGRWTSPLYLVGESYGTTRAAGLSDHLIGEGIALNGIVLISSALDFATFIDDRSNDLPFVLFLPSFTATAWYHKRLSDDLQADLKKTLADAERWAETDYLTALGRGDRLSAEERQGVVETLARYTGLSKEFVAQADLRITPELFRKELLRDKGRTVGRFDGRYQGIDAQGARSSPEYDPSLDATRPIFTSTFNQYVREDLGYKTDLPYHILGGEVGPWDWGPSGRGYTETFGALRDAMAKNPHMKLLIASGLYDLATPYRALEHTLAHMKLDPTLRSNVRVETFPAGHMMYLHVPSLNALKQDAARFLDESAGP